MTGCPRRNHTRYRSFRVPLHPRKPQAPGPHKFHSSAHLPSYLIQDNCFRTRTTWSTKGSISMMYLVSYQPAWFHYHIITCHFVFDSYQGFTRGKGLCWINYLSCACSKWSGTRSPSITVLLTSFLFDAFLTFDYSPQDFNFTLVRVFLGLHFVRSRLAPLLSYYSLSHSVLSLLELPDYSLELQDYSLELQDYSAMPPKSQASQTIGKAPRARRTRAQIEADMIASGLPVASKPTAAAVKRSRLAANARAGSASVTPVVKKSKDSPTFDRIDYHTIIMYLSKPHVRKALFGGGSQTRVSGLPMNPRSLLNPLAIEINNDYNIRHNTTDMRLNGRVLYLRLKRYKGKYNAAKNFSLKTGSGLSAKNVADGIHTMEDLLDSMCLFYKEMDALFRDKGNVTPFSILNSSLGPDDDLDDDSEEDAIGVQTQEEVDSQGETTNGHDHRNEIGDAPMRPHSAEPEDPHLYNDFFDSQIEPGNRALFDAAVSSPPATPQVSTLDPPVNDAPVSDPRSGRLSDLARVPEALTSTASTKPLAPNAKHNHPKRRSKTSAALTAEERALDSSTSDEDFNHRATAKKRVTSPHLPEPLATSAPTRKKRKPRASKSATLTAEERALDSGTSDEDSKNMATTSKPVASRASLSNRVLEPLPSIDPSLVHNKESKHAIANVIQQGNEAKLLMITKANELRQHLESNRLQAEAEARSSDLDWAKEKYFLDRQEQRDTEARRLAQESQSERKRFCEKLVLEGKTPEELEAFLRLVYPVDERV